MSAAYILLHITNEHEFELESHAGFMKANDRALKIAKLRGFDSIVNKNPSEKKINNSIVWTYLNVGNNYIAVIFQQIQVPGKQTFANNNLIKYGQISFNPIPDFKPDLSGQAFKQPLIVLDDPAQKELPGGWDHNGKPVTMAAVIDDPYCVKHYDDLSYAQARALVTARIRKRPYFSMLVSGVGTFLQKEALTEIKNETLAADYIMDIELNWLSDFLNKRLNC